MKKMLLSAVVLAAGALALPGTISAHHGDAGRYNEDLITVSGTLVELQMVNPHTLIVFDVTEAGKSTRWTAEVGGPQQLAKQFGWNKDTMKAGQKITLVGRRLKSGAPYMNLTERSHIVMDESGKEIYRTANYGQPAEAPK